MPYEFSRNIQDATHVATFTLPASASSSTQMSSGFDLGTDIHKPSSIELELSVPALNATMAPDTRTFTYICETSAASNFGTIDATIFSKVFTGASSAGIGAQVVRCRVPSNCARYVRWKVTSGASTADASTITATASVRY